MDNQPPGMQVMGLRRQLAHTRKAKHVHATPDEEEEEELDFDDAYVLLLVTHNFAHMHTPLPRDDHGDTLSFSYDEEDEEAGGPEVDSTAAAADQPPPATRMGRRASADARSSRVWCCYRWNAPYSTPAMSTQPDGDRDNHRRPRDERHERSRHSTRHSACTAVARFTPDDANCPQQTHETDRLVGQCRLQGRHQGRHRP